MKKRYMGFKTRREADQFKDTLKYKCLVGYGWNKNDKHFFEVEE